MSETLLGNVSPMHSRIIIINILLAMQKSVNAQRGETLMQRKGKLFENFSVPMSNEDLYAYFILGREFEIARCNVCGASAVHLKCGKLKNADDWNCDACSNVIKNGKKNLTAFVSLALH